MPKATLGNFNLVKIDFRVFVAMRIRLSASFFKGFKGLDERIDFIDKMLF